LTNVARRLSRPLAIIALVSLTACTVERWLADQMLHDPLVELALSKVQDVPECAQIPKSVFEREQWGVFDDGTQVRYETRTCQFAVSARPEDVGAGCELIQTVTATGGHGRGFQSNIGGGGSGSGELFWFGSTEGSTSHFTVVIQRNSGRTGDCLNENINVFGFDFRTMRFCGVTVTKEATCETVPWRVATGEFANVQP
jgi:hypothetical protein